MRVYALQVNLELGKSEKNLQKIFSYLNETKNNSLILLPEMFSCGFDNENLERHAEETRAIHLELEKISSKRGLVISGTLPERSKEGILNTAFVIDRGRTIHRQAKMKCTTNLLSERFCFC